MGSTAFFPLFSNNYSLTETNEFKHASTSFIILSNNKIDLLFFVPQFQTELAKSLKKLTENHKEVQKFMQCLQESIGKTQVSFHWSRLFSKLHFDFDHLSLCRIIHV